jgi:hypothetical protein
MAVVQVGLLAFLGGKEYSLMRSDRMTQDMTTDQANNTEHNKSVVELLSKKECL